MSTVLHYDREELEDYFLDLLPKGQRIEMEAHLVSCERCSAIALKLRHSHATLEDEMSPRAYRQALQQTVIDGLRAAVESLALGAQTKAGLWLEEIRGATERLSWLMLDAGFGLGPVKVLGTVPEQENERAPGASRPRKVVVVGQPEGPVPEVRIEDTDLVLEFRNIGIYDSPPAVFLIPTATPEQTLLVRLSWSNRDRTWSWRGHAVPEGIIVAVGPPLEGR